MTDKEQIIDVSNCMYLDGNYCPNHDTKCDFVDNCYFREYKRKEQECEELKRQDYENLKIIHNDFNQMKSLRAECARYRKTLEEIEEYTKNFKEVDLFEDIKDIINKAKGTDNE